MPDFLDHVDAAVALRNAIQVALRVHRKLGRRAGQAAVEIARGELEPVERGAEVDLGLQEARVMMRAARRLVAKARKRGPPLGAKQCREHPERRACPELDRLPRVGVVVCTQRERELRARAGRIEAQRDRLVLYPDKADISLQSCAQRGALAGDQRKRTKGGKTVVH